MTVEDSANEERLSSLLAEFHEAIVSDWNSSTVDQPDADETADVEGRLSRMRGCLQALESLRRNGRHATEGKQASDPTENGSVRESANARIGRFEIIRLLGSGSHGIVFLAHDSVLGRDVALKVPRPETLASAELRSRFLRESRTVAELAHPNLVPVYEIGELGPACFIASRYCQGPNLAIWLRDRNEPLAPESAARLVKTLAETVDYIHRRGILHRDIKPANVLLEPLPGKAAFDVPQDHSFPFEPMLADFGLARFAVGHSTETRSGSVLGTPAYMSPEQAESRLNDIGPAADIYGLGAILYELLTGNPPFRGESDLDTLRMVTESRLPAPQRVRPEIPRDLDAVCLKCLEFEPSRRYRSAGELADELQRFLSKEPVRARNAGPLRRLVKWSRRKPVVAGLLVSLTLSIAIGFTLVAWMWHRAERNYQLAEEKSRQAHHAIREFHAVLYERDDFSHPRFQPLRKELLEVGLKYYRLLLDGRPDDPELQSEAAKTLYEIAFNTEINGSKARAVSIYEESLSLWRELIRQSPNHTGYRYDLAKTLSHIGSAQLQLGRRDAAARATQEALRIWDDLCESHPDNMTYRRERGYTYHSLAHLHKADKRWNSMFDRAVQARKVFAELIRRAPNDGELGRMLAVSHSDIAHAYSHLGNLAKALEHYEVSRAVCESLVDRNLGMPYSVKQLAHSLISIGSVSQKMGKTEFALRSLRQSRVLLTKLLADQPEMTTCMRDLADCHLRIAMVLDGAIDPHQKRMHLQQSVSLFQKLQHDDPHVVIYQKRLANAMLQLVRHLMKSGQKSEAVRMIAESQRLLEKFRPGETSWRRELQRLTAESAGSRGHR